DEDAEADPELARLRDEAGRLRAAAAAALRRLLGGEPARRQALQFLKLRDEAFFQLHRDALSGPEPGGAARAAGAARRALAEFPPLEDLPPAEAGPLLQARRGVWLVLAEATARGGDLRAALALVD